MKLTDEILHSYLGNFVGGFEDKTQRRHLRKRGWIEYRSKTWNLTSVGRGEAIDRGYLVKTMRTVVETDDQLL